MLHLPMSQNKKVRQIMPDTEWLMHVETNKQNLVSIVDANRPYQISTLEIKNLEFLWIDIFVSVSGQSN